MNLFGLALPDLIEKGLKALVVVLFGYFVYTAGVTATEAKWLAKWNAHLEQEQVKNETVEKSRRETMRLVRDNAAEVTEDAKTQLGKLRAAVAAADSDNQRLRNEADKLRTQLSRLGQLAGSVTGSPAGGSAVVVLADLYGSCVAHRQILAGALDESHLRGMTCQNEHNVAKSTLFKTSDDTALKPP